MFYSRSTCNVFVDSFYVQFLKFNMLQLNKSVYVTEMDVHVEVKGTSTRDWIWWLVFPLASAASLLLRNQETKVWNVMCCLQVQLFL